MEGLMILVRSGPEETERIEEALRLAAAMLGFDELITIVFIDDGIRCLHPQAFSDPALHDYLQAAADLAGVHVVSSAKDSGGDLDPALGVNPISMDELVTMMRDNSAVASF
jgi:sulfur relay (sulfurtransferase) complex TusBCD TusD component (DsrE family)